MLNILKISLMNYVRYTKSNSEMHTQQIANQYDKKKKNMTVFKPIYISQKQQEKEQQLKKKTKKHLLDFVSIW